MELVHSILNEKIKKQIADEEQIGFLLTNKEGGYCWLNEKTKSRYQGIFFNIQGNMYKVIEEIKTNGGKIKSIRNNFFNIEVKREKLTEIFFMPFHLNTLVYELNKEGEIEIILDIRESYSCPEWNRFFNIYEEDSKIIIKYNHNGFEAYLVISTIPSLNYKVIGKWFKREYSYDKKRKSPPFERYVYSAIRTKSKRIVLSFSNNKEEAVKENTQVLNNLKTLKEKQKKFFTELYKKNSIIKRIKNKKIVLAYISALSSLENLIIEKENKRGIYAGLPWFFQFWTRDELISIKALSLNKKNNLIKDIINKTLKNIRKDGTIPNMFPDSSLSSADAIGWLFKGIELLKREEIKKIKENLKRLVDLLIEHQTKDYFAINKALETWMDSSYNNDTREGVRIEIQAFRLNIYRFMYNLTKETRYLEYEIKLKEKVRRHLWNGMILADGLNDYTIRPNIFIAAYTYPFLLTIDEWERCFENALSKLWLKWGGLSTIDKDNLLFSEEYSGEDNKSYHRGDSWFWLNNLSAIALHKTNKKKFKKYIKEILNASTEEILYKGAIGNASELSSAKKLESNGCICQAFSNALFIELVHELF